MRLPALRFAFLRHLSASRAGLGEQLIGRVLILPADLSDAEREEICDLAVLSTNMPVHVTSRDVDLPEHHVCVITEPVDRDPMPVKDSVVIVVRAVEAGRRRLGLSDDLRRLRDAVLTSIAEGAGDGRLGDIAAWAQEATDSPSTALRFAGAAHRESLKRSFASDAELVIEGLAETIAWLFRGVNPRVAEWVLARAVPSTNPGRLVSLEAALLGEGPALQRALACGLVEHLSERADDPDDVLDLRRPVALLGRLDDLSVSVDLPSVAAALRQRIDPLAWRVFDRLLHGRPKPLRLLPPPPPLLFVGRDDVLSRLSILLEPAHEVRAVVLHGVAGIGKTAVAAALCERLSDRVEPVWLTFAGGPEAAWQRVADALGMETAEQKRAVWLGRVHRALADRDALLVIDDVDGVPESELPEWLPGGAGTCAVLVLSTQAQPVLQRERDAVAVSLLAPDESAARVLLASKVPRLAEAIRQGEGDALLRQLGSHPAAIRMAASLLEKQSLAEVTALVERGDEVVRKLVRPALDALDAEEKAVVEALAVAARTGSPVALVGETVGVDAGPAVRRLAGKGLVELGVRTVRLHGVVRVTAEGDLEETRRRELEVAHAWAVDAVLEAARVAQEAEGEDEAYADGMLALGRMTERCRSGEHELADVASNVAFELSDYPRGVRAETLSAVVRGWRAVLGVWTREQQAKLWASAQNGLGIALCRLPTGTRAENLQQAVDAFQAALTVVTKDGDPEMWATIQHNLGNVYNVRPGGDRSENAQRAVEAYEKALTVRTEHAAPQKWAMIQNSLGNAFGRLQDGDDGENQRRATEAYRAALRVFMPETDADNWAMVQNNLGGAYLMRADDRAQTEDMSRALEAVQAALTVWTRQTHPENWATAQQNLGTALARLPEGDGDDNLRRAIDAYQAALTVRTRDFLPWDWASTQRSLGSAMARLTSGDRRQNLKGAIEAFRAALTVYTEEDFPSEHALTQSNLDAALRALGPATDRPPPT